jgi:hypothetical protein
MSVTYPSSLTVEVPLRDRRPGRKMVITPEGGASPTAPATAISTRTNPALVKALARAFRYQRMLDEDRYSSITEMAEAEKLDRGYMGRLLQLTLLAPSLVEAALDEREPEQLAPSVTHEIVLGGLGAAAFGTCLKNNSDPVRASECMKFAG